MSTPKLPDIRKHHLNKLKASSQVLDNINFCHDNGITSDAYKVNENIVDERVKINFISNVYPRII